MAAAPGDAPLWSLTATELAQGYRARRFTPGEALEAVLARLADVNPLLNAVVAVDAAAARAAARAADERHRDGRALGPLDGIPVTVKDNLKVRGLRSTWGSALYADHVPDVDELPVARLRAAGAVIVGKTNCPEFTVQGSTVNALHGATRNPWNPALTPGGSSGGAVAAVAAGIGPLALATDGGGSIRRPASYTGLVGLKPSEGRVPRRDGFAPILFDHETVGPIARCVADVEMALAAISAPTDRAASDEPEPPARILYVPRFGNAPVDAGILAAVDAAVVALRGRGHVVDVGPVPFDLAAVNAAWPVISQGGLAWLARTLPGFETQATPAIRAMAAAGAGFSAADYVDALMSLRTLRADLARAFARHDVLLTPAAAAPPWPVEDLAPATIAGQPVDGRGHAVYTAFVNLSGCSALALPCGLDAGGLPVGLQLVAAPGRDDALLRLAADAERAGAWRPMRPTDLPGLDGR